MTHLPFPPCGSKGIGQLYDFDRLQDFVGNGSFATVFKARRRTDGQTVALKVVLKAQLESEKALRDVVNEVEILRKLNHRNCLRFVEVLQSDHEVFIVTEFLQGKELYDVVKQCPSGHLPEAYSATILIQILEGCRYLHRTANIVHRDLKPENIIVCDALDGEVPRVCIVDFGFSKYLGPSKSATAHGAIVSQQRRRQIAHRMATPGGLGMTLPINPNRSDQMELSGNSPLLTTPCGTLKFSSPELVKGLVANPGAERHGTTRQDLLKRDVYSVGLIAYILLSGLMPFSGTTKAALAVQMERPLAFAGPRWARVSDDAKAFVRNLLSVEPSRRPTAEEALGDSWLLSHRTIPATPSLSQLLDLDAGCSSDVEGEDACVLDRNTMRETLDAIVVCEQGGDDNAIETGAAHHGAAFPSQSVRQDLGLVSGLSEVPVDE